MAGSIALLGLGLIGGSIARALRARSEPARLVAWTPSAAGPRAALAGGVVDAVAGSIAEALTDAEMVILAGPPIAILDVIAQEADALREATGRGATVTDVASTKRAILSAADRAALPFVGGHPMAGRETAGFGAADPGLFEGRPWIVVPGAFARERDVDRIVRLARAVGAEPWRMPAAEHDAAVAGVSHLPLVVSAALVDAVTGAPDWATARDLAAGGWVSMTRLARGDPEMGAGILVTNRDEVLARLRAHRAALDEWIVALEGVDVGGIEGTARLRARLEAARAALDGDADG